ncbi:MAG: TonB family protein [Acidobacteriales bacterium]|nr:TonB family protein [Terriglobales bacterium]
MPHALLLSPDDQAVSAITGVLEEMSVTCERPLDGPSAAKKLGSQSFDLVLVDCENLPAAKLIFDVCRRPKSGTNPVPIAIVDGRAGLPTAFRLGAELILTKPVAKDQARTTIRTAVSRLKKDEPARAIHPFEDAPAEIAEPPIPEMRAQAAAAAVVSSPPSRVADLTPPVVAPELPAARMHSVVDEIAVAPKAQLAPSRELPSMQSVPVSSKSAPPSSPAPLKPSDDPVLADLEAETDLPTPVFSSYREPQNKNGRGSLVALLLLMLAGGGFYAAWMYQPGFREMAQPQIDRVLALVGMSGPSQNTAPPRQVPSPPATTSATQTPAAAAAPDPGPSADAATAGNASPAVTSEDSVPIQQAVAPTTSSPAPAPASAKPLVPESRKSVIAVASDTELPGEKSAIILSSQGAEKRLVRHQQPTYPAEARKDRIQGTVVLKVVVSETGKVEGVRLVEGNPTLAAAAINSVKQWHYRPYLRDGKAQPFQTIVLVDFQRP